jgi:prolyl oligopeptidase
MSKFKPRNPGVIALCALIAVLTVLPTARATAGRAANATPPAFLVYPETEKTDTVDVYSGVSVPDPYRWLEDTYSAKTEAWVKRENAVTQAYLEQIPARKAIKSRLTELWNYERCNVPNKRGDRLFYTKNDGLQNQNVLYVQDLPKGQPRVLLDPNKLSADGTVDLANYEISDDGKLLSYGLAASGSDWQIWHVKDVNTGQDLSDQLKWIKNGESAFTLDGKGLYYSRYDEPAAGTEMQAANYFQKLFFHKLGTPQSEDKLIFERKDDKEISLDPIVSDDGKYLTVIESKGTSPKYGILVQDLSDPASKLTEVFPVGKAMYQPAGNVGTTFFFLTDDQAPKARMITVDLKGLGAGSGATNFVSTELIKETKDTLEDASIVDNKLICRYLKDAYNVVKINNLKGEFERQVVLPGFGTASGFAGKQSDKDTYYLYTSFNAPSTVFHLNLADGSQSVFFKPHYKFNSDDFTTEQIFYQSKDGTKVPMFVSYKKGLKKDGNNPTYLYGYGGFKISLTPSFSASNLFWMESGGILAIPTLRGGGEYGEEWHEGGMKKNKQNVFDDFISAGETLIEQKYTSKEKLSIGGGSNGGLLVGACETQRPDLFAAAVPAVGVMDMLRFNKFTVGWGWTQEYGTPENADDFKVLYAYSPLHHIKKGTCYPATLVTTADHDDRVVPGHSFKFAAAMQAAQACSNPILIRIDSKAGHGHGKSTEKMIDEAADKWAFLFKELNVSDSKRALAPTDSSSGGSASAD